MPQPIDLLLKPRWVVRVEPDCTALPHHAVAIHDTRIVDCLPVAEAERLFSPNETVELPDHALIPGLINAHAHAGMNLLRGFADDLSLMRWLHEAIWPAESKHASAAFVRDGTLLAAAEMLAGGITTCNDMYFFPDAAAEAFDRAGMRAMIGMVVIDFPTAYATGPDDYLAKGLSIRDKWKDNPRMHFSLAPHAPYTVSDETFRRIVDLADELDLTIHLHLHETREEVAQAVEQSGKRPFARLDDLGIVGPNLLAVHTVHLDANEIATLRAKACRVVHCPSSNMKLASGIAPVRELLAAGIPVALGSDGAASNNRLDLFQEMRHAALLAKVVSGDASAVPAQQALWMATMGGAHAIGLEQQVGSILPGKQADLIAISLSSLETRPCFDPVSHLVYAAGREHVSHVWVDGKLSAENGKVLQIPNKELLAIAALWQNKLKG
ncbi:TRZ/ATZ family hydrolase [Cognatazoarcus halotolerans]|uniref:TRZ/ATZ family hydrolase n=1 Tax=Cognatazoarcus halotolerans TaxID=2686016 RepID=UPI00135B89FA|nr:TRZ/ATZ family hydrolase [Cognatazoarcus halotolerans]MCB1897954.1 TRZ/ATZ family hydrolase [Rhodocyclaceae bacterium]MCP5309641.1 TRZ/ATZ family hydrolase [Zoogloeaceae bacterium]